MAAAIAVLACALAPRAEAQAPHKEILFVGNNWEGTADVIEVTSPGTAAAPGTGSAAATAGAKAAKKCRKRAKKKGKPGKRAKRKCRAKRKKATKRASAAEVARAARADEPVQVERLGRLNIIPDINERSVEILSNPVRLAYFLLTNILIGEGHNQYVDDMYSSNDGELLIVSRPSLADVVAIRLATGEVEWRFPVAGQRSDHMAISPDGRHVAVSASTGNVVHILNVQTGEEFGRFPSGDSPHENTYSADGKRIYHASIGTVYTPLDLPLLDTTKGARYFQVVDAQTLEILKRIDMGQKLEEAGYPDMSSAVRPMAITSDERFAYLQVSFFHGIVEYDLVNDQVRRVINLPDLTNGLPRELYLLDSAHHGIAINGSDDTLCVAGTMSDYAAIVSRADPSDFTLLEEGEKSYWATTSDDGRYCYVSWSGTDSISVISYASRREVGEIEVGDHPQRIRTGHLSVAAREALTGS